MILVGFKSVRAIVFVGGSDNSRFCYDNSCVAVVAAAVVNEFVIVALMFGKLNNSSV